MSMICTIILLVLLVANFGLECSKHGQCTVVKHNAREALAATIITLALLYGAGLFDWFVK